MRVRPATEADAERIAEIHVAAWRAAYREQMPAPYLDSLDVAERAAGWRKSLAESHTTLTALAIDDLEIPVGFCVYGLTRDRDTYGTPTGEIIALNVMPSEWRCGYGRALLDASMADADRIGWRTLTLWVLRDNQRARAFYENYGFRPDGAEKSDTHLTGTLLYEVRYRMPVRDVDGLLADES